MKNGRRLSNTFMSALKVESGPGIDCFLQAVRRDKTLCLEIRENYINIYYRGGNLTRIEEINGKFIASFDRKYIKDPDHSSGSIGMTIAIL